MKHRIQSLSWFAVTLIIDPNILKYFWKKKCALVVIKQTAKLLTVIKVTQMPLKKSLFTHNKSHIAGEMSCFLTFFKRFTVDTWRVPTNIRKQCKWPWIFTRSFVTIVLCSVCFLKNHLEEIVRSESLNYGLIHCAILWTCVMLKYCKLELIKKKIFLV